MTLSGGFTRLEPGARREAATARVGFVTRLDRWLATRVQRAIDAALVRLELWDGSSSQRRRWDRCEWTLCHR